MKGSGVEGDSELGATIMEEQADLVIEAVRTNPDFYQIDAILLIAGAAGGFGSGALPVLARHLKSRFQGKIIYALVILPFERESNEDTRAAENTANCLKSIEPIADAVFLVNNELYRSKSLEDDYMEINREIVKPFYNLLCAGAEKRRCGTSSRRSVAGPCSRAVKLKFARIWETEYFTRNQNKLKAKPGFELWMKRSEPP